jgi:branched-subunit amino acid ABC-type transport system permease component
VSGGVALQAVVAGLAVGSVYGLVGLGFTLVHRMTRVLSFAHGDLVLGTLFVSVLAVVGTTPVVTTLPVLQSVLQVAVALAAGALLSALLYAVAVRPFSGVPGRAERGAVAAGGWVAGTLAVGLLLRESLGLVFEREAYAVADPLRLGRLADDGLVGLPGGGTLQVRLLGVLAIGLLAGVAVERFVVRSATGRALRAVADDPQTAALMGVPAERLVLLAFVLAGALAGLAGILVGPGGRASVGAGVVLGLKGTAAALLGRLGSVRGAIVGGLVLGVAESLAVASERLGPAYADVLALAILVLVLAWRPEGLRSSPDEAIA